MHPKVRIVIDHMNANLHRAVTLGDLAQLTRLSRSRLCCVFKKETGISPGKYLRGLKMQKARELLDTTLLSEKEIRATLGILDHSHFVRDFKKTHGVTLSQYRKKRT